MHQNILIIGGNGFIGSHIVDILKANNYNITVLSLHQERYRKPLEGVEYLNYDYGNISVLKEAIRYSNTILHLAHDTTPKVSFMDPLNEVFSNIAKFIKLLELVKDQGKRIVYFSSGGTVYGNSNLQKIAEDTVHWPISPYGVAKSTMEKYLYMYHCNFQIPYLIIRPSNVYGIRSNFEGDQGIIPIFIKKALHNEKIQIWGTGENVRDYIYVTDLARAVYALIRKTSIQGVFNIGFGEGYSIKDVANAIFKLTNQDAKNFIEFQTTRSFDVKRVVLDNTKIKSEINWQPEITLNEGIVFTRDWLKSQLNL